MAFFIVQMLLLAAVSTYAARRGGQPECRVAAILCGWIIIDRMYHAVFGEIAFFWEFSLWHFTLDSIGFLCILTIALRANRLWTLLAASAQLLSVMSHIVLVLDMNTAGLVYAIMNQSPFYLLLLLVAIGTWNYTRRHPDTAN